MAASKFIMLVVISLHAVAFGLAMAAERRRSTAEEVPDEYDKWTFCRYSKDVSTIYGLSSLFVMLVSHTVVNSVTSCLCLGKGLTGGGVTSCAVTFFILSWASFLGVEACLIAGSARNAYHTKYRVLFDDARDLSCATLRRGVFAAASGLIVYSMIASTVYYWAHSKADTGGWKKHQNDGVNMGGR